MFRKLLLSAVLLCGGVSSQAWAMTLEKGARVAAASACMLALVETLRIDCRQYCAADKQADVCLRYQRKGASIGAAVSGGVILSLAAYQVLTKQSVCFSPGIRHALIVACGIQSLIGVYSMLLYYLELGLDKDLLLVGTLVSANIYVGYNQLNS